MSRKWLILFLIVPSLHVGAQGIRLTKPDAPNALYFDLENAANYNMYEHWRYELNVTWVYPNENSPLAKNAKNQFRTKGYWAYTTGDQDFKYGISASLKQPKASYQFSVFNDMFRAASRDLGSYSLLNPSANTGFVASYFVGVKGGMISTEFKPTRTTTLLLGFRQTWEDYRFDGHKLLFPAINPNNQSEIYSFSELVATLKWKNSFTLALRGGYINGYSTNSYLRAILQYKKSYLNNKLNLFSQLGFASKGAPYSRMFDLSGTAYSGYFFYNTLLTIRPNTFAANTYAHVCLNYTLRKPLWDLSFSKPKPFIQVNALWGNMFGQDQYGQMEHDGLWLQAPCEGLLEPAIGIDGILRWGVIDFGAAIAYQICPKNAIYCYSNPNDNWAFTIIGNLNINNLLNIR